MPVLLHSLMLELINVNHAILIALLVQLPPVALHATPENSELLKEVPVSVTIHTLN